MFTKKGCCVKYESHDIHFHWLIYREEIINSKIGKIKTMFIFISSFNLNFYVQRGNMLLK